MVTTNRPPSPVLPENWPRAFMVMPLGRFEPAAIANATLTEPGALCVNAAV
jgi:hypothetical protein